MSIPIIIMQGLDLLSDYDYIAIFDADFKPDSDFLVSNNLLTLAFSRPNPAPHPALTHSSTLSLRCPHDRFQGGHAEKL